ncbi:calcium binding mitochondrial carrier protein [Trichuris trichiura]|uniref:Calcium binding mitochondrial carrier protein n=1 Tax=Trichuris trichiura TaxID=36087 RepID=A0A077YXK9_TRITR|nr:calcium binding mitochondrial carrier protein [Trichuris trichiura]
MHGAVNRSNSAGKDEDCNVDASFSSSSLRPLVSPSHFYQLSIDKEEKLRRLYNELDTDGDGRINFRDLLQALKTRMPGVPHAHSYAMHVMEEASASHGEAIEFVDFVHYMLEHEKRLTLVFEDCDRKKDGVIDSSEIMHYLEKLGVPVTASQSKEMVRKMGSQPDGGGVALDQFLSFFMFYPCSYPREMANHWRHNLVFDIGEDSIVPEEFSEYEYVLGAWWQHLLAGAAAGSVSRTCTAPLDRVKVFLQVHASVRNNVRFFSGLRMLVLEGGLKGMWRGNGVNVLKIAPESAIKFMVYEQAKKLLKRNSKDNELTMFERILSGSLAGSIAQTLIYPLEVLKTRLALRRTGQMNRGIIRAFREIYQKEGLKAFYRGFIPNLIGIIPYAGIDLAAYEQTFKANYVSHYAENGDPPVLVLMACGTASSICGQLASYPFSLVRTRLQARARSTPCKADTMTAQFRYILRNEGFTGLYRGLTPNFMKVLPSVCISYVVYETVRKQLGATMT